MPRLEDRQIRMTEITVACAAGARLAPACRLAGIDLRTFQRWRAGAGEVKADRRPEAVRPRRSHALSEAERARIVELANGGPHCGSPLRRHAAGADRPGAGRRGGLCRQRGQLSSRAARPWPDATPGPGP